MKLLIALCVLFVSPLMAYAVDRDGLTPRLTPAQRQWVKDLHPPNSRTPCCDDSDGMEAEWKYCQVNKITCPTGYAVKDPAGLWQVVYPENLIEPNKIPYSRAWWSFDAEDGVYYLRCFVHEDGA